MKTNCINLYDIDAYLSSKKTKIKIMHNNHKIGYVKKNKDEETYTVCLNKNLVPEEWLFEKNMIENMMSYTKTFYLEYDMINWLCGMNVKLCA